VTTYEGPATGHDRVGASPTTAPACQLVSDQALIEQATGVLAERLQLTVTDAATTLTDHAHRHGQGPVDIARTVVDGTAEMARFRQPAGKLRAIRSVLTAACALAGLDPQGAELIRWVGNAVFRLARHPVVVKIVLTADLAHRADTAVAAARLLATHGVPAIRLWLDIPQPLHVGQYAVTLWQHEDHTGAQPTATDLASLITRLHRLPITDTNLPAWEPIPDLRHRIADAEHADPDDLHFLLECCDRIQAQLPVLDYALPTGVVHGDAHLGNLIPTSRGPLWCDLDSTSIGPTEWDLIPVAVAHLRFPNPINLHQQLASAYGFDVTTWPGFPVLRQLRELKLVTSALPVATSNPAIRTQLHHRLHTFRTGDTTPWARYS
jgi:Phosphotransferase enzyme family/ANTAR domain